VVAGEGREKEKEGGNSVGLGVDVLREPVVLRRFIGGWRCLNPSLLQPPCAVVVWLGG
jgi:hypothetical protein